MLSSGQSSSKYLKTEIPQMLAIIHLQDQRYWYPYSINIHAETKHYVVGLKPVKSIRVGNCNGRQESRGKHSHSTLTPAHQTHTVGDECSANPFCFVCACVSWAYTWAWAYSWAWPFFGLKVLTCRTWAYIRA